MYEDICSPIKYLDEKSRMKQWLHVVLLTRVFGRSADSQLLRARQKFTSDFQSLYIDSRIDAFPMKELSLGQVVSEEGISEFLSYQKDGPYTFSVLALLYPHLNFSNEFHKDHIHPETRWTEVKDICAWERYNSVVNLQLLDGVENESKNKSLLKDWVDLHTTSENRLQFLNEHLIPNVSLELADVEKFFAFREELLAARLRKLVNMEMD